MVITCATTFMWMVLQNLMMPGLLKFSSITEDAKVKPNTHMLFYIRSGTFSTEHTDFLTLNNIYAVTT